MSIQNRWLHAVVVRRTICLKYRLLLGSRERSNVVVGGTGFSSIGGVDGPV